MISLDGYAAGPEQSEENPLGIGGMQLTKWLFPLEAFRRMHGEQGGEVNASTPVVESWFENIGATVMGRNMFGGGTGDWGPDPWMGFWGDDPPFHHPVFILTHHPRDAVEMQGGTTFNFVTDGIESALTEARAAAEGEDVSLGGGPSTVRAFVAAGLLDEMLISLVPVFLGDGTRPFDGLGAAPRRPELLEVVEAPGVTHLRYRFA